MISTKISGQQAYIYSNHPAIFAPEKKQGKNDDSSFGKPPEGLSQDIEIWDPP